MGGGKLPRRRHGPPHLHRLVAAFGAALHQLQLCVRVWVGEQEQVNTRRRPRSARYVERDIYHDADERGPRMYSSALNEQGKKRRARSVNTQEVNTRRQRFDETPRERERKKERERKSPSLHDTDKDVSAWLSTQTALAITHTYQVYCSTTIAP